MDHLYYWNAFAAIPGGVYRVGSSEDRIQEDFRYWSGRLLDGFDRQAFLSWLYKEYPGREVKTRPFHISRYPVTAGLYRTFISDTDHPRLPVSWSTYIDDDTLPVWGVSYENAASFCAWLGGRLGRRVRIPTEAEWEIAAAGPACSVYPYGDEFDAARANSIESGLGRITPVDHFPKGISPFGLYDMAGNVEEWTSSTYRPYPGGKLIKDDLYRAVGPRYRILKGGSYLRGGDLTRCARRHGPFPDPLYQFIGFRVAYN